MCARITVAATGTEVADLFGLAYDLSAEAIPAPVQRPPVPTGPGRPD